MDDGRLELESCAHGIKNKLTTKATKIHEQKSSDELLNFASAFFPHPDLNSIAYGGPRLGSRVAGQLQD
jgi:hypothetical protein